MSGGWAMRRRGYERYLCEGLILRGNYTWGSHHAEVWRAMVTLGELGEALAYGIFMLPHQARGKKGRGDSQTAQGDLLTDGRNDSTRLRNAVKDRRVCLSIISSIRLASAHPPILPPLCHGLPVHGVKRGTS